MESLHGIRIARRNEIRERNGEIQNAEGDGRDEITLAIQRSAFSSIPSAPLILFGDPENFRRR